MKFKKSKGILFWITGLSGSGKTSIGKLIFNRIKKKYGPTIILSGDDIRKTWGFNKYSRNERILLAKKVRKFLKFITNQEINVIYCVVCLMNELRIWNRKNIDNYVEIYIKSNIEKNIKIRRKKKSMFKKGPIVGLNIKPEFPKNPNIVINNDYKKSLHQLADELIVKLKKI